ncbi:c-type cytochrome [Thermoproteota archaeon]
MISKSILATMAIVLILIIGGGIYIIQQSPAPATAPTPIPTTPVETPTTPKTLTTKPSPPTTEIPEETPKNVADGEILYRQNCAGCHGSKGVGSMGPALSSRNVDRNKIENGIADAGMPVFKKILTPEEITAIINFLKS